MGVRGKSRHNVERGATPAFEAITWETHRPAPQVPSLKPQASGPQWSRHPLTRLDALLAVALFAAAILARWPLIQRGDTLLHPDEAIVGLMAQDIAAGERFPIYFYGQRYMGALEAYVIAGLSFVVSDPIFALRLGPALFFAALVAAQYLMLTRWFGRRGGLLGALVLVCGPPMFAQWSISARGGYIEILLWGTLLLWSYTEWFCAVGQRSSWPAFRVAPADSRCDSEAVVATKWQRLLFGLLLGSGLWINQSIIFFVAPILLHTTLARYPDALDRLARKFGNAAWPVFAVAGVLLLNCIWASWVEEETPRTLILIGALPRHVALAGLGLVTILAGCLITRRTAVFSRFRTAITAQAPLILGILIGAAPAALYAVQAALGLREMEPSLPLGLRPLWKTGETMVYLFRGLPILFGADPQPFVDLVTVGRERSVRDLSYFDGVLIGGIDWLVLGALATVVLVWIISNHREWGRLLRLERASYSPIALLSLGFVGIISLYVLGGCSFSFTTIRYLLPMWAFVPGILAFVFTRRRLRLPARLAPLCLCGAWAIGQSMLTLQLGRPHPLRDVAAAIEREGLPSATAEILDAHLLSYLTRQSCRVQEYEPFWPRLTHYRTCGTAAPGCESSRAREHGLSLTSQSDTKGLAHQTPVDYIVDTREFDRTCDWTDAARPGPPPPETQRALWPAIQRALIREPSLLVDRRPLAAGYEHFRLRRALPRASHRS